MLISIYLLGSVFYYRFKNLRKDKKLLNLLLDIYNSKKLEVYSVNANQVIRFGDRGEPEVFYLIKENNGQAFYLYDEKLFTDNNQFPCEEFEIYLSPELVEAFQQMVNCVSKNKIRPIVFDTDKMWEYFDKRGWPKDLEYENKSFETVAEELRMFV